MKRTRLAPAPDAPGPLAVRVLTLAAERQRFDALLAAEHFLGPASPPATVSIKSPSKTASGPACCSGAPPPSISRIATPGSAGTR